MSKFIFSLPFNFDKDEWNKVLADLNAKLLKSKTNKEWFPQAGDALRFENGIVVRIMDRVTNEVGEPFLIVANNHISVKKITSLFIPEKEIEIESLPISVRACRVLVINKITTLQQAIRVGKDHIKNLRDFGDKSMKELERLLQDHNMSLT